MNKKYELMLDNKIEHEGRTLYRIKALKDFGNVKAGELGGYIQNEDNLSHDLNCWVYSNAKVFDNAKVYDNAKIYGSAFVCGNAKVYGYAHIFGNAEVFGSAIVYDYTEVYDNASVYGDAKVYGSAKIMCNSRVYGDAKIEEDTIIGKVSMPYKKIFQYQCKQRLLTAILTENDEILYSLGCQTNIDEEVFIYRIHNEDCGLKENPHRAEYLKLIPAINIYFKGRMEYEK